MPIYRYDISQGSDEWAEARRGIPTASEFAKIVTPGGKLSKQSRDYAYLLIAEQILGRSLIDLGQLEWVAYGKGMEAEAARWYELERDLDSVPIGFILSDDGRIGCSPDRLVGDGGMLEIKSPAPQTHVGYMINGFSELYKPQVQGQLLVSEREWTDWLSYSPELPPVLERVYRDESYIALLREALDQFCAMKESMLERARALGVDPARERRAGMKLYAPTMEGWDA